MRVVCAALVVLCLLSCFDAKPPPPPGAPWAPYVAKTGFSRRAALSSDGSEDSAYSPLMGPLGAYPFPMFAPFAPPGLAFNPVFGGALAPAAVPAGSPMAPFLKIKPFLPTKPTFMPPVVDSSKFIDMKADLLNSLFPKGAPVTRSMGGPPPFVGAGKFAGGPPPFAGGPFAGGAFAGGPFAGGPFGGKKAAIFGSMFGADGAPKVARALMSPFVSGPPGPVAKPPPPAFLADLFKTLGINKTVADPATSPAIPAVPAYPGAPAVDPGILMSKKAKFLGDLFSTLGIPTTVAPPPEEATSSWDSNGIVDPTLYTQKIDAFLDKLFDSLNISRVATGKRAIDPESEVADAEDDKASVNEESKETIPEDEQTRTKRSISDADDTADNPALLLADAKDKVVETIISELSALKNSMVGAVSDLAQAQKDATAAAAAAAAAKKPLKPGPGMSPYAALWGKPAGGPLAQTPPPPTPVPVEPVQQRVALLGQVFDMLAAMEKDITSAMVIPYNPANPAAAEPEAQAQPDFMDALNTKLEQIAANATAKINATAPRTVVKPSKRLVSGPPPPPAVDPAFWIPSSFPVSPDAYLSKTQEYLAKIMASKTATAAPGVSQDRRRSYKPNFYQQQQEQEPAQQQVSSKQNGRNPSQGPPSLATLLNLEYIAQNHHHHHNRQPYWWN